MSFLRWLTNLFPIQPQTFEDFLLLLEQNKCQDVVGLDVEEWPKLGMRTDIPRTIIAVGIAGMYKCMGKFTAVTPEGRRIEFLETYGQGEVSLLSQIDQRERDVLATRSLYTVYDRLLEARERLPTIKINLINERGRVDEVAILRLKAKVRKHGLTSFLEEE